MLKKPKKMKYVLIEIRTQDGEHQYTGRLLKVVHPRTNLDKLAEQESKEYWGDEDAYLDGRDWFHQGGTVATRVQGIKELSKEHYDVLTQYI